MQVNDTITDISNQTAKTQFENRTTGTTELSSDDFLNLLMTQLKYQDPMNPMDNAQFIQQQAQFTQVSELQKLNKAFGNQTLFMEASSLIGKTVNFTNPDNPKETLEGKVTEARFNDKDASIVIGGRDYPLDSIVSVKETETEVQQ